jgi:acyl-CoA thioesterase-1
LLILSAAPVRAESVVITALGTSLTAGFGVEPQSAFPVPLQAALSSAGVEAQVINSGVSGDTSAGGLARLSWAINTPGGGIPDLVIVELGSNDGLRGLDPNATKSNLDQILAGLAEREIAVLLTGMLAPPNLGRDYGDLFNAIYPDLAARHNVALFPFFLEGVAAERALNQADGIHPNPAGVAVIVDNILPFVLEALSLTDS